eukprot:COSAG03_NODE_18495_length_354_cov_0.278431_1_plen_76_part_10
MTCSPEAIPQPLVDQLVEGGIIIVPMGERHQQTLFLMKKTDGEMKRFALQLVQPCAQLDPPEISSVSLHDDFARQN